MIQIPRNLVRLFRTTLRKLVAGPFSSAVPILLSAQNGGLRLRTSLPDVQVEYFQQGDFGQGEVALPAQLLKDWDAARVENLTLTPISANNAQAEWLIDGIPQSNEWQPPSYQPDFPVAAKEYRVMADGFPEALRQVAGSAASNATRFALNCIILLDGGHKRMAATDGRQLLVLNGWDFPWQGEVLLPALKIFSGSDLDKEAIEIGKTDTHLTMRFGFWTLHFGLDSGRRFPRIDQIIPRIEDQTTTLIIDPADREFLVRTLPRLPCQEESREAITLDVGSEILLRAKGDKSEQATEVVLSRSRMEGEPLAVSMSRIILSRAMQLGLERIYLKKADQVLLAQDANKMFVWLPMPTPLILPAQANARRIASPVSQSRASSKGRVTPAKVLGQIITHNGRNGMHAANGHNGQNGATAAGNGPVTAAVRAVPPNGNGHCRIVPPMPPRKRTLSPGSWGLILEECVKLREQARHLGAGVGQLIRTLKSQRKQNRLVESTLSSLKQIKGLV